MFHFVSLPLIHLKKLCIIKFTFCGIHFYGFWQMQSPVYHIKPQPHAGPGIYGAFLLYNWRSSIVYHVCRWSVTSSNRNYFLVKLREENIVGCVAFWKKFVVSRLVLQSAWLASLKYLYFFYIITEKYNIWNIFTNSNVS